MIKLTDTQMNVLASACERPDGVATRPAGLKPAQVAKVTTTLIDGGLAEEVRAKAGYPVWRKDEAGQAFSLKVLKAGRAIVATSSPAVTGAAAGEDAAQVVANNAKPRAPADPVSAPRAPKQSAIVALMQRPGGASIADLIDATGWLPHTTRAALTGLRKKGFAIARSPAEQGGGSVYRIGAAA